MGSACGSWSEPKRNRGAFLWTKLEDTYWKASWKGTKERTGSSSSCSHFYGPIFHQMDFDFIWPCNQASIESFYLIIVIWWAWCWNTFYLFINLEYLPICASSTILLLWASRRGTLERKLEGPALAPSPRKHGIGRPAPLCPLMETCSNSQDFKTIGLLNAMKTIQS